MIKKIIIPIFCAFLSFAGTCGEGEASEYILTVDGYLGTFTGYYYIDGNLDQDFSGSLISGTTNHYYYEKSLPVFTSIKVYVTKDIAASSVEATIWKDDKQVESVSVGINETDEGGSYIMTLPILYYEATDTSSSE